MRNILYSLYVFGNTCYTNFILVRSTATYVFAANTDLPDILPGWLLMLYGY